ncbi:hypothetical protein [Cellulomonas sp. NPDC058312]|uniref:hypothetical protein n=1 Tax=Cellulomonas sp. NPDC058312 TaxID=3346441 RepID=UPI0036E1833A
MRALSTELGPQAAVLRMPPTLAEPWCSDDELAAVQTVRLCDGTNGIQVATAGALTPRTALALAGALAAHAAVAIATQSS